MTLSLDRLFLPEEAFDRATNIKDNIFNGERPHKAANKRILKKDCAFE